MLFVITGAAGEKQMCTKSVRVRTLASYTVYIDEKALPRAPVHKATPFQPFLK